MHGVTAYLIMSVFLMMLRQRISLALYTIIDTTHKYHNVVESTRSHIKWTKLSQKYKLKYNYLKEVVAFHHWKTDKSMSDRYL